MVVIFYAHLKTEFFNFQTITSKYCDPGGARTLDPLIKSQLLYQLSHGVKKRNH